jgi:hypothetical protein
MLVWVELQRDAVTIRFLRGTHREYREELMLWLEKTSIGEYSSSFTTWTIAIAQATGTAVNELPLSAYLFHGRPSNHSIWVAIKSVERYIEVKSLYWKLIILINNEENIIKNNVKLSTFWFWNDRSISSSTLFMIS